MKLKWIVVLLFVAAVASSKPAFAQCEHAGTTSATFDCFDHEYKKADAELNRIYKLAFTGLDEKAAKICARPRWHGSSIATHNAKPNMTSGAEAVVVRVPTWRASCV
jgi:hypothetical protein